MTGAKTAPRHVDVINTRLNAVRLLQTVKQVMGMSYRALSRQTGLSVTVLSRYYTGYVLPSPDTATRLIQVLTKKYPATRLLVEEYPRNPGAFCDPLLLELLAADCINRLRGKRVNYVVACDSYGLPFATILSQRIVNCKVLHARGTPPPRPLLQNYRAVTYMVGEHPATLWMPRHVKKNHAFYAVAGVVAGENLLARSRATIEYLKSKRLEHVGSTVVVADGVDIGEVEDAFGENVNIILKVNGA